MPKSQKTREHWSTANATIQRNIGRRILDAQQPTGSSAAIVQACVAFGYDLNRDEIPTPYHDAIAADLPRLEAIRRFGSMREADERRALALWDARNEWRKTTRADEATARVVVIEQDAREKKIRLRAVEIMAENQRKLERLALEQAAVEVDRG